MYPPINTKKRNYKTTQEWERAIEDIFYGLHELAQLCQTEQGEDNGRPLSDMLGAIAGIQLQLQKFVDNDNRYEIRKGMACDKGLYKELESTLRELLKDLEKQDCFEVHRYRCDSKSNKRESGLLDLHHQHQDSAILILIVTLIFESVIGTIKDLIVVTGQGLHSQAGNSAAIKNRVMSFAGNVGFRCPEVDGNPGRHKIELDQNLSERIAELVQKQNLEKY